MNKEYSLDNGVLSVRVSSIGGQLLSVKKDGKEYLWQGDPAFWEDRAPNLFPYIARLTFHLPIHGFLPAAEMKAEAQEESLLVLRLDADESTLACYPFVFTLRIRYELNQDTLRIAYEVENGGTEEMYFGIGGHPGFQAPLEEGLSFEDYFLEFESEGQSGTDAQPPVRIGFSPTCFLNGKDEPWPLEKGCRIPLRHDLFDDDAIVLSHTPKTVVLRSEKGGRGVRVRFPQMPYIGFWHAVKKPAPYVCIEPWSSLPSRQDVVEELSEQPGLIHLEGKGVYRNLWSIQLI